MLLILWKPRREPIVFVPAVTPPRRGLSEIRVIVCNHKRVGRDTTPPRMSHSEDCPAIGSDQDQFKAASLPADVSATRTRNIHRRDSARHHEPFSVRWSPN